MNINKLTIIIHIILKLYLEIELMPSIMFMRGKSWPLLLGITLSGKSSQEEFKIIINEVVTLYQEAIRSIGEQS